MVSAIFIIVAALAAAFLLGLIKDEWRETAYAVTLAALGFMTWLATAWLLAFVFDAAAPVDILTAGTPPPFAINLRMALPEAVLTLIICATGFLSALALRETLLRLRPARHGGAAGRHHGALRPGPDPRRLQPVRLLRTGVIASAG